MQKSPEHAQAILALPPRRWSCTIEEVALINADRGWDIQQGDLRSYATIEWLSDLDAAARMRDERGLSEDQHRAIVDALRVRNKEIWGPFSAGDCVVITHS